MSSWHMTRTRSAQSNNDGGGNAFGRTRQASQRSHSRKPSNATTASRSTVSPSKRDRRRRPKMVRDSLLGAHIHPMTVDHRAELLAGVAGDCVAKVLAAGFERTTEIREKAEQTWTTFQALRKTYFFGDDAPSIIFYRDIIHLLPKYTSSNHHALARAIELCNLTTFAYIILNPDFAGRLAPSSRPSYKGKERARDASMVQKRNGVLLNVWEKYWQIIPESEKASEEAMRMWLALATQIVIHYRSFKIDPASGPDQSLEGPSREVWDQIFHPSAVARFGRWDLPESQSTDGSGIDGMTQEIVEGRWARAMTNRAHELKRVHVGTLIKRYPYDEFRRNMFAYLDSDIVRAGDHFNLDSENDSATSIIDDEIASTAVENEQLSIAPRRSLRHRPPAVIQARGTTLDVTDQEPEAGDLADAEEETDMESAEAFIGEPDLGDAGDDNAILDTQILADVVREMESDNLGSDIRSDHGSHRRRPPSVAITPSKRRREQAEWEDDDWEVRDVATPGALTARQAQPLVFNFATRQDTAVQVDWESQTPAQHTKYGSDPRIDTSGAGNKDSAMPGSDSLAQGFVPAGEPLSTSSDTSITPRPVRGPLFPFRGYERTRSPARDERVPMALRKAPVPLVADFDVAEEEEAVEGGIQDRPLFDARERFKSDADNDGDELLPQEVLNRRFLLHKANSQRTSTINQPIATDADVPAARYEDEASDDGTDLLPPEIRVARDIIALGRPPLAEIPDTIDIAETDNLLADEDGNDLLPSEIAEIAKARGVAHHVPDMRAVADTDSEMDGNELLPLEVIRQNQRSASRPFGGGKATLEPVNPDDQEPQGNDLHPEQIPIDDMTNDVIPQLSSRGQRNQVASGPKSDHGFAGDNDLFMEDAYEDQHVPALSLELGMGRTDRGMSSQRQVPSFRSPRDPDSYGFVIANEAEDEEDRLLLQEIDQNRAARQTSQLVDVKPFARLIPPFRAQSRRHSIPDVDLYTLDEDGGPLATDETYRIPPDHVPRQSRLHGQVAGQSSAYSRLSGKKRWTEDQALLLYRTLQKVPLDVAYPLRVVWYLHGEHGAISQRLEDFNPQHMKDKIVTILRTRTNNRLSVEGRARMYLPKEDVRRQAYDQELRDWEQERKRADRAAREELDRIEAEQKAAEKGSDEDVDEETDEEEDEVQPPSRSSRTTRSKRKVKRDALGDEEEDIDDDNADNGDDDENDGDDDNDGDADDDGNDVQDDNDGDNIELGSEDESHTEDHETDRDNTYEPQGSRSNRSGKRRVTRSHDQPASRRSRRYTRAARASQAAEQADVTHTGYQAKGKRGRSRKDIQKANDPLITRAVRSGGDEGPQGAGGTLRSSGTQRQRAKEADPEQTEDNAGQRPPSNRAMRSTSSRSRLMAEVVVPVRRNPTRSKPTGQQAEPDIPSSQKSKAQRATKPRAKRSRAAKISTGSRSNAKPGKRSISHPVTESPGDSEREIDGLIDDAQALLGEVGMLAMSDLESEEGDEVVGPEPLSNDGAGDTDEPLAEPVNVLEKDEGEGETESEKAAREAEAAVRRKVVQQKVLSGAD